MADGVAITAGSGTTVLTDDTGATGHAQVTKQAYSADGSATLVGADVNGVDADVTRMPATAVEDAASAGGETGILNLAIRRDSPSADTSAAGDFGSLLISNLGQLWVKEAQPKRSQVASTGLTTASTAYSALDQVGALFTFANFALATGGGGLLTGLFLADEKAIIGTYTAWLFRSSVTLAADNAAFALSDADAELAIGDPITLGPVRSATNNWVTGWYGAVDYDLSGTSLYIALQAVGGHTFFTAAGDLKLTATGRVLG